MTEETENTGAVETTAADTSTAAADTNSTTATAPVEGQGQGEAGKTGEGTEGKTETGDGDGKTEDPKPEGAPGQYEDFTLPEGFALEGDRLEAAHEFARANNWTQEQAQAGVETYLKFRAQEREYERGAWATQSETEFGEKFDGIAKGAQAAIVELEKVRPGITDRLDATNLGNHPDILYVFSLLGERGRESGMHGLGGDTASSAAPKSIEARMYPSMQK